MKKIIGIRREDKNEWEKRTPVIPDHVKVLLKNYGIEVVVQPSKIRAFKDSDYQNSGAKIDDNLTNCNVIFGIKEFPVNFFEDGMKCVFFSHTIKGQKHNMPMLKKMMEKGCTLIDYEKITDAKGRRLIFFGRHAGLAGMIDTLWAFGKRIEWEGITPNPFEKIHPAHRYSSLEEAKSELTKISEEISRSGIPRQLAPLICGFAGYGNVSKGAQEIFDIFPVKKIEPSEIAYLCNDKNPSTKTLYKVVFEEKDTVSPRDSTRQFDLQEYYKYPERYFSIFNKYLPYLTILMNCIYWEKRYPRLVTREDLKNLWEREKQPRLRVIGDISCDLEGAIEATVKITTPQNPIFVYDVETGSAIDGWAGKGPVILAVDNLPCEIPVESSKYFSEVLIKFIPSIVSENFDVPFEKCTLPDEIKKAVILWKGELTPDYQYLSNFLKSED